MYDIINSITKNDIFYSIIIIIIVLFILNNFNISLNNYLYILIIIILLLIYKYHNNETLKLFNKKLNMFNLKIDNNKYNNIIIILNNIHKYKIYNEYAFENAIHYINLFINHDKNNLLYLNKILNNITSMTITIPIKYHNEIYYNINKLKIN